MPWTEGKKKKIKKFSVMKKSFLKNELLLNITAEYKGYNLRKNSLAKRLIERDFNEITVNYMLLK